MYIKTPEDRKASFTSTDGFIMFHPMDRGQSFGTVGNERFWWVHTYLVGSSSKVVDHALPEPETLLILLHIPQSGVLGRGKQWAQKMSYRNRIGCRNSATRPFFIAACLTTAFLHRLSSSSRVLRSYPHFWWGMAFPSPVSKHTCDSHSP